MNPNNLSFQDQLEQSKHNPSPIITLLTDFGLRDGFIGVMKGVMLQIAPNARLVDISHDLPHFSIEAASFLNEWSFRYFPVGTVHLCVIDPGVGTSRRVLVVETLGHYFVAPDNGLLTPLFEGSGPITIISATNSDYWLHSISNTFHGRDIFSPVAAHVARGIPLSKIGDKVHDPVTLAFNRLKINLKSIECQIQYIDHFGNSITNLNKNTFTKWLAQNGGNAEDITITFKNHTIQGISLSYAAKNPGEVLAVFDGYDRLEIAVRKGSAQSAANLNINDIIRITLP